MTRLCFGGDVQEGAGRRDKAVASGRGHKEGTGRARQDQDAWIPKWESAGDTPGRGGRAARGRGGGPGGAVPPLHEVGPIRGEAGKWEGEGAWRGEPSALMLTLDGTLEPLAQSGSEYHPLASYQLWLLLGSLEEYVSAQWSPSFRGSK